jgi:hypothetical protein
MARTEDTSQYAWKRTLIFEPAKRVLWWHLPIISAIDWSLINDTENMVEIVVKTPYETVSSLVSWQRADILTDLLRAAVDQQPSSDNIVN